MRNLSYLKGVTLDYKVWLLIRASQESIHFSSAIITKLIGAIPKVSEALLYHPVVS